MWTKHIWTNTESLKPCFTAYPVQHKTNYVQSTVTDQLLALTDFSFFLKQQTARPFTFSHDRGTAEKSFACVSAAGTTQCCF